VATGLGLSPIEVGRLTLPQVYELYDYWEEWPPMHELLAGYVGYERPLTLEEQYDRGAMGPAEFLHHYKATGGKLPKS
jgi:hypothetical protein